MDFLWKPLQKEHKEFIKFFHFLSCKNCALNRAVLVFPSVQKSCSRSCSLVFSPVQKSCSSSFFLVWALWKLFSFVQKFRKSWSGSCFFLSSSSCTKSGISCSRSCSLVPPYVQKSCSRSCSLVPPSVQKSALDRARWCSPPCKNRALDRALWCSPPCKNRALARAFWCGLCENCSPSCSKSWSGSCFFGVPLRAQNLAYLALDRALWCFPYVQKSCSRSCSLVLPSVQKSAL